MKQLVVMLKPASSLCNLRCKYCFYADLAQIRDMKSFGIMTAETAECILENIKRDLAPNDRVTFSFQGGEPTLAGLEYFRHFTEIVSQWDPRIQVQYTLQTNGLLIDAQWCQFLSKHSFLVGVSLDILPQVHNRIRTDAEGNGTYQQVLNCIRLLEKYHIEYNVLCTLTKQVARHPLQVFNQIKQLHLQYVQFTPCMDHLAETGSSEYALTPECFASFYRQLFPLWDRELRNHHYYNIKLFDDILNLLACGIPTACGMDGRCRPQIIVEADGSVYPCDFYAIDAYRIGNLCTSSIRSIYESPGFQDFIHRPHKSPTLCNTCKYQRLCGGNCKRMQQNICCSPDGTFCGYASFLDSCMQELLNIISLYRIGNH